MIDEPRDAALAYAHAGVAVLPLHTPRSRGGCSCGRPACPSPGKHPRTEHGVDDASTDEAVILAWWDRWPNANVGGVIPPGCVVADVDHPERLNGTHLPPTLLGLTGRGAHYWYTISSPVTARKLAWGELKVAASGYVVLPPSRHPSGRRYEWSEAFDRSAMAPAPPWITEAPQTEALSGRRERFQLPEAIGAGARHDTLLAYGGALRRVVEDDALVRAALVDANSARCRPPLPDAEIDGLVADVVRRYRPEVAIQLDLDDESGANPQYVRLPPETRPPSPPRPLDPLISDSRTLWFGAGQVGKGVLAAVCTVALADGDAAYVPSTAIAAPLRVGIVDAEDNFDEWADRLSRIGAPALSVPYRASRGAFTRRSVRRDLRAWIDGEGVELIAVDSVLHAAGVADAMKPEGAIAYYAALAELERPSLSLAHTRKDQATAEYPFGSVYWSTPARLIWRVERPDTERRHLIRLVNTKHARWPAAAPLLLEVDWSGSRLRLTSALSLTLEDDVYPLVDRIVTALAAEGRPLTAEEIAERVHSTPAAVRVQSHRHAERIVTIEGRPHRYSLSGGLV